MPPTMAEREAELAALQSAFDEYIASSRELEEELDAELAKMQEKLADSSAANAALSAQLENIAPQLAALEKALSESRNKLKEEQKLRRQAEQAQDELEAKFREAEGSLLAVREECDAVHEELAFKESELEETRLELEIEREKHRVELEDARADNDGEGGDNNNEGKDQGGDEAKEEPDEDADLFPTVDDAYVKKLEDELELVTEQLIETEARLSQTEEKLAEAEEKMNTQTESGPQETSEEDKELIKTLQEELDEKTESESKLREELELTKEELSLTQEELKAVEFDATEVSGKLDTMRAEHREEINKLKSMLNETQIEAKGSIAETQTFEKTLAAATEETVRFKDEIDFLNTALANAKADHAAVVNELEEVQQRFDEVRQEAEKRGRESAATEIRAELKAENEKEIADFKEQLKKLTEENTALQQKVDDAEMALATAKDGASSSDGGEQSELVKQLQSQLARSKEELAKKESEMSALVAQLEEKASASEEKVSKLENELSETKGKLAEAEANLIVTRREKEIADQKNIRKSVIKRDESDGTAKYRSELIDMDEVQQVTRKRRYRSNSPNSSTRLEIRVEDEQRKYKELEDEHEKLKNQKRIGDAHVKRLEEDIKVLQKQLYASGEVGAKTDMSRLSSLASGASGADILSDEKSKVQEVIESGDTEKMKAELLALDKKCNAQRDYNNQLLSKMLSLQGNIQVFCRIRPMSIKEIQSGYKTVVEALSESELGCFDSRTNSWKSFAFDRVWGPDQSQQSIFQDVEPIALSVVDGFNACIFAYGQTGSGKTYTMEGAEENNQRGISYRTIQKVFHLLSLKQQQEKAAAILMKSTEEREEEPEEFVFQINVGMLEIYNDECYDLLGSGGASLAEKKAEAQKAGGKASLEIRRNQEGRIEVPNLTTEVVNNIHDVINLLKRGNKNRAVASTSLNTQSSRSHMVLWVDVTSGMKGQPGNKGTLFLVDLAGSERVKKSEVDGDNLKEASHINKSLSALGNVMEALDRKAAHVPYRDSKLTFLLQDSLGGNSRTMMVVAVTPVDYAYDESIHALQFATRVRRINIGAAQRNVTSKNLEETVKELTAEMKKLTMQKQKTDSQLNSLKKDNDRIQGKLGKLDAARKASKSDNKTLEVLRKNNDDMAKRWQKEKVAREAALEEVEKTQKELAKLQKELARLEREKEALGTKLEEKDKILEKKATELRTAKEAASASNIRARKAQVLGSRARPSPSKPSRASTTSAAPAPASTTPPEEVAEIREKVLALLEEHDQSKVNRIDIIMEKFKGKEKLLLEKMTQRYENGGDEDEAGKTRSEIAAKRHMDRMKALREKKGLN